MADGVIRASEVPPAPSAIVAPVVSSRQRSRQTKSEPSPQPATDAAKLSPPPRGSAPAQTSLGDDGEFIEILHTNDTHDHLTPYDKTTKSGAVHHVGGIAQRAAFVAAEKAAHPGQTLVLDDGDSFQGTSLYTAFKGEPDMKAMSMVGYDVGLVGNHDLDDGWGNFKKQMTWATFPILGGNVVDAQGDPLLPATQIVQRGKTTIGIIGLMGDSAWQAVAPKYRQDIHQLPIIPQTAQYVQQLRAKCDLIVVMSHNGYEQDQALAKAVPGIDVIVGSHSHTPVFRPTLVPNGNGNGIGGTLVVQAGANNEYIGKLQLRVKDHAITGYAGELVSNRADYPVPDSLDQAVRGVVEPYAAQLAALNNTVIGQAPPGGLAKNAFPSPLGVWISQVMQDRTGADVGLINMHGVRETMPEGPMTVGSVTAIAPFDNELRKVTIPGADLLKLVASTKDSHSGVTMSGVQVQGDQVLVGGKPVDPNGSYTVGTIDYILDRNFGGTFDHATDIKDDCFLLRNALIEAVKTDVRFHPAKQ
jgi:2',3'-cyclic-nucleotide 2'-phosphodiesterase (5'-nucleotidase family)